MEYVIFIKQVYYYFFIPILTIVGSTILFKVIPLNSFIRSTLHYFSAGVVFAAISIELIPEIYKNSYKFNVILGYLLGSSLMLLIQALIVRYKKLSTNPTSELLTLLITVGIDIFIDGLLLGVSFVINVEKGIVMITALSIELLFLILSVNSSLDKINKKMRFIILLNFTYILLVVLGISLGLIFINCSRDIIITMCAFATAAFLYLVVEELLREAHKEDGNQFSALMFFIGFLIILIIK